MSLRSSSSFDEHVDRHSEGSSSNSTSVLAIVDGIQPSSNARGQSDASLTFTNGLALVLGLQIGSGIFFAPSQVSNHVPSPGAAVVVWLVAGILVWTGAASFIELGLAIPKNGGVQEYLRICYSEFLGFLFSWTWIVISKPCAMAMIAMIFAQNLGSAFVSDGVVSVWIVKSIAVLGISVITLINCLGTIAGARAANAFLVLKLLAISSIVVIGIAVGITRMRHGSEQSEPAWFAEDPDPDRQSMSNWAKIGDHITAVYGALFCYGGWETIGFVAGEMADPPRDLPRVINAAMSVAVGGFVLVNVALYTVLPFQTMRERSAVAVEFGFQIFGPAGGLIYSLVVSVSCLGALNANMFATGRLMVAASNSHYFPKILGNGHCSSREGDSLSTRKAMQGFPTSVITGIVWFADRTEALRWDKKVPVYAMITNTLIVSFYILIGTFDSLVTLVGITEYFFFLLAVIGVFVLRRRKSVLDNQPYKTWTLNPSSFCVFSGFIVIRGIITDPLQGLAIFLLTLVGWGAFRRLVTRLLV